MSDLDTLRSLTDQIVPPPFDALRETARRRNRRARIAVGVSAAAAIAVAAGAVSVVVSTDDSAPQPATPPDVVDSSRPLTYAEGSTIRYGDLTVTAPAPVTELDLTDDGTVVRTEDGGIWFTDGTDLEQIGTLGEPGPAHEVPDHPYGSTWGFVVSGNSGSRVAWFEFPQPGRPELVVWDTRSGAETARLALDVEPGTYALLASVTEQFAYWYDNPETVEDDVPLPLRRIDLETGAPSRVTLEAYQADSPPVGTARTMTVSHADGGGPPYRVIDGTAWQFSVRGGRVEPQGMQPLDARDGATNRRFVFDAPAGYPDTLITWLTQWLDDDTVVLVAERDGRDDLLECRFSTGACAVAERLPAEAVVPEIG